MIITNVLIIQSLIVHQSSKENRPFSLPILHNSFLMRLERSYFCLLLLILFLQLSSRSFNSFQFSSISCCFISFIFVSILFLSSYQFSSFSSSLFQLRSLIFFCQSLEHQFWKRSLLRNIFLLSVTELSIKQQKLKCSLAFLSGELLRTDMFSWRTLGYHQFTFKIVFPPSFLVIPCKKTTSMLSSVSQGLRQNYVVVQVLHTPLQILQPEARRMVSLFFFMMTSASLSLRRREICFKTSTTLSIYYPSRKIKKDKSVFQAGNFHLLIGSQPGNELKLSCDLPLESFGGGGQYQLSIFIIIDSAQKLRAARNKILALTMFFSIGRSTRLFAIPFF